MKARRCRGAAVAKRGAAAVEAADNSNWRVAGSQPRLRASTTAIRRARAHPLTAYCAGAPSRAALASRTGEPAGTCTPHVSGGHYRPHLLGLPRCRSATCPVSRIATSIDSSRSASSSRPAPGTRPTRPRRPPAGSGRTAAPRRVEVLGHAADAERALGSGHQAAREGRRVAHARAAAVAELRHDHHGGHDELELGSRRAQVRRQQLRR